MKDEKKRRYTAAQKKSAEKYLSERVENIMIRVPKGKKAIIQSHAVAIDESMNQFINRAIDEAMNRDMHRKEGIE